MLKKLRKIGNVDSQHYAYLYDRIAINRGELQHYGTQGTWKDNSFMINECDAHHSIVDQRRLKIGLGSFAAYNDQCNALYK